MSNLLDRVKEILATVFGPSGSAGSGPRRDPSFVGHSNRKDIENAPPERAAELAGHATERVET